MQNCNVKKSVFQPEISLKIRLSLLSNAVVKLTYIESPYMVSSWSVAFTIKSLEDILRLLKEVLRTSLKDVLKTSSKKLVATSISDQCKTSLRPKLRRFYDVFATSLCRLWGIYRHLLSNCFENAVLRYPKNVRYKCFL